MPILSCQSPVRATTAQPATRTDLHVAPLRLHEFATVATSMIVWARETGPGLRRGRPAAIDPAKADQRKVAHRLVVLSVVAVHDGPEELQRAAQCVDKRFRAADEQRRDEVIFVAVDRAEVGQAEALEVGDRVGYFGTGDAQAGPGEFGPGQGELLRQDRRVDSQA